MNEVAMLWLAPGVPLAVFVLLAAGLARFARLAIALGLAGIVSAGIASVLALRDAAAGLVGVTSLPWVAVGGRSLVLSLRLDALGTLGASLVSIVSVVVFAYAAAYMPADQRRGRFFAWLSLFAGSMLALVLAADLVTLFIAWELVGVCSYLLIGFWSERPGVGAAATKALVVTRVGDLAMLAGILLLISGLGSGSIGEMIDAVQQGRLAPSLVWTAASLLLIGAAAKSAQVPFQGWLPDAMVGPTPVSALLHSATMVAAGVFVIARLHPLFHAAPSVLAATAWLGVATALLGAAAALVDGDLKRTLAYSTMSQIGLMFVGLGAGSIAAALVLLVAHAFYKALLFFGTGIVDHAVGETSFDRMGGLARQLPWTALAFGLGVVALGGLPVTLALPAKDVVVAAAWQSNGWLVTAVLLASLLTALYSARVFGLVFLGAAPSDTRVHRVATSLVIVVVFAATLVPLALLVDARLLGEPLSRFLVLSTPDVAAATAISLAVAAAGLVLGLAARLRWPRAVVAPPLRAVAPVFRREFGLARLYTMIARRANDVASFAAAVDGVVFDALAARAARGTLAAIRAALVFDTRRLEAGVRALARILLDTSESAGRLQTGRIENYLLPVFAWGLALIALAIVVTALP